ncbi:type IV pilin N-terminal domain-containing protein [Methanimicrococcus sp. OttesenSCG-928-J09]|nr:type IV pilin N-terminal domain-containing protein [Methanimicrococcus sp. OttesenSCG-928-J09]
MNSRRIDKEKQRRKENAGKTSVRNKNRNSRDKSKAKSRFNFFSDNQGISPVVGVLLLLAITVVMAGYLATEVLSYEFSAPSAPVSLSARVENVSVGSSTHTVVRLEHSGGAPLQMSNIRILFNQSEADLSFYKNETFGIGESILIGGIDTSKTAALAYPISQSTKKPSRNVLKSGESSELVVIDTSNNQILFKKVIYVR